MGRREWKLPRTDNRWLDDESAGSRLIQSVDAALGSLRGRRSLAGSDAVAMFELLGDALPDRAVSARARDVVAGGLDAFRDEATVPTAIIADHLLDLRLATSATSKATRSASLVS